MRPPHNRAPSLVGVTRTKESASLLVLHIVILRSSSSNSLRRRLDGAATALYDWDRISRHPRRGGCLHNLSSRDAMQVRSGCTFLASNPSGALTHMTMVITAVVSPRVQLRCLRIAAAHTRHASAVCLPNQCSRPKRFPPRRLFGHATHAHATRASLNLAVPAGLLQGQVPLWHERLADALGLVQTSATLHHTPPTRTSLSARWSPVAQTRAAPTTPPCSAAAAWRRPRGRSTRCLRTAP